MPPALDRLLASPSSLRLLRSIVNAPEVPAACSTAAFCWHTKAAHRNHTTDRKPLVKLKWRRWRDTAQGSTDRDKARQLLEADAKAIPPELKEEGKVATPKEENDALIDEIPVGEGAADDDARWAACLSHRERLHGQDGIKAIWDLRRYAPSYLPVNDTSHAEYLWGTFVKRRLIVTQVIDHAAELLNETGQTYPRLYELVMSYWLPRHALRALEFHHLMLAKLHLKNLPLNKLARYGSSTFKPAAYEALLEIYLASNERDLYDEVVLPLIVKGKLSTAHQWHNVCLSRNDMPTESVAAHPVVQIFTLESSTIKTPESSWKESPRDSRKYNQDLMRRLSGRDTAPVRFEDSFCARMFATKTIPPETIIKGLTMVGVNEIGPQAVLAMASRTEPLEDLPRMFEELRVAGIALQGCVYSLAMEKFAMEQKWQLVRSMLDSDQHPDVFGDDKVQRELLDFYLDQEDHVQVQRTLAILTLLHNDPSQVSWNLLLQTHIRRTGPQHVTEVLQDMRARGVMVTIESIAAIKSLLRRRQLGRKPIDSKQGGFDDLRFVARIFTTILEFGMGTISPWTWRELIRRFGMTGRFKELRRLLLWLLCWYAPRSSRQFANLPVSPFRDLALTKLRSAFPERTHYFHFPSMVTQQENGNHPIRQLLPPSLQQAIIIWGFRAGILPNATLEQSLLGNTIQKIQYRRRLLRRQILQRKQWNIGLRTVVLLRDLGVYIHYHTVVKALQMQFIVLFGHGQSKKLENRVMEEVNTMPYAKYVQEVNNIWGSQLLKEPHLFGKGMIHEHMWHPRMRRRTDRRAAINLDEILGPDWQRRGKESDEPSAKPANEHEDEPALKELKSRFAAQEQAMDPGAEWMHEASLDTTGSTSFRGGRGPKRRVKAVSR